MIDPTHSIQTFEMLDSHNHTNTIAEPTTASSLVQHALRLPGKTTRSVTCNPRPDSRCTGRNRCLPEQLQTIPVPKSWRKHSNTAYHCGDQTFHHIPTQSCMFVEFVPEHFSSGCLQHLLQQVTFSYVVHFCLQEIWY